MAGLFEGQGHLRFSGGLPALVMASSDLDVVTHVASVFGSTLRGPQKRNGDRRDVWVTSVQGSRAVGWMMTLYSLFGKRSQTRVREVLGRWRKTSPAREQVRYRLATA
jgi:hypothetical protein